MAARFARCIYCPLAIVLTSLCYHAAASGVLRGNAKVATVSTEDSVTKIKETLGNLLRSAEDGSRDAGALYKPMSKWCNSVERSFKSSGDAAQLAVTHLRMDLSEEQASAEEVEGMTEMAESEMALIQRTVNQTSEMLQDQRRLIGGSNAWGEEGKLVALLDNKVKTLDSLQRQLHILHPTQTRLRAQAAETEQRLNDRHTSQKTYDGVLGAIHQGCVQRDAHAQTIAQASVSVSAAMQQALQSLQVIAQATHQPSAVDAAVEAAVGETPTETATDDISISFVQTDAVKNEIATDDDLLSIFDAGDDDPTPASQPDANVPVTPSAVPRIETQPTEIQQTLAHLTTGTNASAERKSWCEVESSKNKLAMRDAKDSLGQTVTEMELHTSASAEIDEELQRVDKDVAALRSVIEQLTKDYAAEKRLLGQSSKDQHLAVKILQQASAIVSDLRTSRLSGKAAEMAADTMRQLTSALNAYEAQHHASNDRLDTAAKAAVVIAKTSEEALKVSSHEKLHLGRDRDVHQTLLAQGEHSKLSYQTEVNAATGYLQKLAEQCTPGKGMLAPEVELMRKAEVHALQDAEKVLEGKQVEASAPKPLLSRSAAAAAARGRTLTPMERAAAEMGIDVDDSGR